MTDSFDSQVANLTHIPTPTILAGKTALITGASSGIGMATAWNLAGEGCNLVINARRQDRLEKFKKLVKGQFPNISISSIPGDLTDPGFARELAREASRTAEIVLNNAGLARGADPVSKADPRDWKEMIDTNITAAFTLIHEVLPRLLERKSGHIINIGSLAGRVTYEGGSVYCATKYAVKAFTESLRQEICGTGVRLTLISPGMVESEFSIVRFHGDEKRADQVYSRMVPLTPSDIARHIIFALKEPAHVNIDEIFTMPSMQGAPQKVARFQDGPGEK